MITSIKRIVRVSFVNFFRQGGLSFATSFILVMAISLIASIFVFKHLSDYAISSLQEKIDISVYFKTDSTEEDILKIKDEVVKIPEVKSVEYISKEQALADFTEKHKDEAVLMESITEIGENPLLASLSIKAWQLEEYQEVSDFLSGLQSQDIIEKVDYYQRKSIIEKLSDITSGVKTAGIVASIFLSLMAVLVTFNTIKLAILNQKEEISIQRLVGASNWFIRGPFFVQGIISGVLSALISFAIFGICAWILDSKATFLSPDINYFSFFASNVLTLFSIQMIAGVSLGVFSSMIAIRKYLRV
jgi:cell division transport system permease protein